MGLFSQKKLKEDDYYFTLNYEFKSKPQKDYSPDSFTFGHSYVPFVELMARDWFGDDPITIREALKNSKVIKAEDFFVPKGEGEFDMLGEPTVDSSFLKSYSRFNGCEQISWNKSAIAKKWQSVLESKGLNFYEWTSAQNSQIDILMGTWILFDDHTVLPIIGEAWKDTKTGKEFVYWFIDALIKTRKSSVTPMEFPTHQFFYPWFFQKVGYLSETIFPSSMVRMRNRDMEFGVETSINTPKIALNLQTDYYVMGINQAGKELEVRYDWAPEVTRYGYIIDDLVPFERVDEIVIQLVNTLPKVASILMDGFANWCFNENINFQSELFTDLDLMDPDDQDIYLVGLHVPGPAYCELARKSVYSYGLLGDLSRSPKHLENYDHVTFHRGGLWRLVNQGIGPVTVHALNSLYFRMISQDDVTAIPESARINIENILTYFTQFPYDRQDSNAFSNLALLQTAWGNHKEALESANRGIALFASELQPKYITELSGSGLFYPIIIKWELYFTKARILILLIRPNEAKEPLTTFIQEARAMDFSGQELVDAEALLATL